MLSLFRSGVVVIALLDKIIIFLVKAVLKVSLGAIEGVVGRLLRDVGEGSVMANISVILLYITVSVETDLFFLVVDSSWFTVVLEISFGLVACSEIGVFCEAVRLSLIKVVWKVPADTSDSSEIPLLSEVVAASSTGLVLWEVSGVTDVSVKTKSLVVFLDSSVKTSSDFATD